MADQAPFPDLSRLSGDMYRAWEQSMTQWWDQVLESPAFLSAMGDNLSRQSQARRAYEERVDDTMEQLHLPTRKDMVRLARIATLLEDRLLSIEDQVLALGDRIAALEKENLRGRVETAEALVGVQDSLEAIQGQLSTLSTAGATRSPRRRKPAAKKRTQTDASDTPTPE